jgi:hypothetical protein
MKQMGFDPLSLGNLQAKPKERYYIALRQMQGTIRTAKPDWQPWLVYFLGVLTEQKLRLEKKIARERILLGDLPPASWLVGGAQARASKGTSAMFFYWKIDLKDGSLTSHTIVYG